MSYMPTPHIILPTSLDPRHADLLREHHFENVGALGDALTTNEYDGLRIIYAITNPEQTEIVYVGDTEEGRDVRSRLRDHLSRRSKAGRVEVDSLVCVHAMVTEYMVLDRFEEVLGALPVLNKRKVPKHQTRNWKRNDSAEERRYATQYAAQRAAQRAAAAAEKEAKKAAKLAAGEPVAKKKPKSSTKKPRRKTHRIPLLNSGQLPDAKKKPKGAAKPPREKENVVRLLDVREPSDWKKPRAKKKPKGKKPRA